MQEYRNCNLCERRCGVDRTVARGFCKMPADIYISRAALHEWEEPIISGTRGSGTIFFSGCSLGCIFCQNRDISRGAVGKMVSTDQLSEIMLRLERAGAHNVNLVTPTHYVPGIKKAILTARSNGLSIPIVYNTGSYDTPETIRSLSGLVDIYIPDMKYFLPKSGERFSLAKDYPSVARAAISEMVAENPCTVIDDFGIMTRGVVVRLLLLPGHVAEAKLSLKYLYDTYGDNIYISLMSQYTPMPGMPSPLDRRVTRDEYRQLVDYADRLGITNCFVQEIGSATTSYIPNFKDCTIL